MKSPKTSPWKLSLIALILAGCASEPTTPPPDWRVPDERTAVTDPKPLPVLCAIPWQPDDVQCWQQLDAFDIVAEGNTEIAQANANGLRNQEGATDAYIRAGQFQQQLTEFYREQLKNETREHWIDNATHRILIALGLIAVAL
jgi:hypothetical protein